MGLFKTDKGIFTNSSTFVKKSPFKEEDGFTIINTKAELEKFIKYNNNKTIPPIKLNSKNVSRWFQNNKDIESFEAIDVSKCEVLSGLFSGMNVETYPELDTSNAIMLDDLWASNKNLKFVPKINTSKCNSISRIAYTNTKLLTFPDIDTKNCTDFSGAFERSGLIVAPKLNTELGTDFRDMFFGCKKLVHIPIYKLSKAREFYCNGFVAKCNKLDDETIKWILEVGKGLMYWRELERKTRYV